MGKRQPNVPTQVAMHCQTKSKSDLIEVLWDLMIQSPWFDEASAEENQTLVCERIDEIVLAYKAAR